jgi:glycosyltransferase involved in cell wall biosynthesis
MARVLILCGGYPDDLSSGADLRFQNLCKQLASRHECFFVGLGDLPPGASPEQDIGVRDAAMLPKFPTSGRSPLRHFRLTNTHFLRRSSPGYVRQMQDRISELLAQWDVEIVVCLVPPAAEILSHVELPRLLDYCDSRTLTFRRILENRGHELSLRERAGILTMYFRQRARERALVREFDVTTTISGADRDCLLEVSGVEPDKVVVIPNGVSAAALATAPAAGAAKRSVVFWGNLDFPPNWTAVDFFYRQVFLPHLAAQDVELHLIGKGADDAIRAMAEHPDVHLHGFVDDLYAEIATHGAMVNPMVEGSGLKNKVLEAFACRLPVVSTTMGIEAVGAEAGTHHLVADNPEAFAAAVLRCLDDAELAASLTAAARRFVEQHFEWDAIGARLDGLVREICP